MQTLQNLSWFLQFGTSSKLERFIWGSIKNFYPLYFGWEIQLRGNFWQGPFSKGALLENGTKSHNLTNLIRNKTQTAETNMTRNRMLENKII